MAKLEYYKQEEKKFKDAFATGLSPEEARWIFKRLKRKYNLEQELCVSKSMKGRKIKGNQIEGCCCECHIQIGIPSTVGTLAHEVAHAMQYRTRLNQGKPGRKWHDKKHAKLMESIINDILF